MSYLIIKDRNISPWDQAQAVLSFLFVIVLEIKDRQLKERKGKEEWKKKKENIQVGKKEGCIYK